jgi:hypothetical protein
MKGGKEQMNMLIYKLVFLFLQESILVCFLYSRLSNFSAIRRLSPLPVTGLQILAYFGAQGLWAWRDLYRSTPTATWDLGLYGLIRKTGTHVC